MTPLVALQFALCPVVLAALLLTSAPYGRHYRAGWGPALPARLAWFAMEFPALLVIGCVLLSAPVELRPVAWIPWLLWSVHYGYRTLLFPALMRPSASGFPLLLVVFAWGFNTLNGINNGRALLEDAAAELAFSGWHVVTGVGLFVTGFLVHVDADARIRRLRSSDFRGYGVPRGGLFRWVSSPHYLGEIIQWAGWALLTWSWAGLAFAVFTACNLVPRAIDNHRWYRRQFSDYPAERRIILPRVF